jgi:hypothetical protein
MLATLACPSGQVGTQAPLVDVTGSRRRLQALGYIGHSIESLADHLGEAKDLVRRVQDGRADHLPATLAGLISAVYDALWNVWGGDEHAAWLARSRRYAPALAWDDNPGDPHYIDDPACPVSQWHRRGNLGPRICACCENRVPYSKQELCAACAPARPPARQCERCEWPVPGRGRYCSLECRTAAMAEARAQREAEETAEAGCRAAVLSAEVGAFDAEHQGWHWRAGAPRNAEAVA